MFQGKILPARARRGAALAACVLAWTGCTPDRPDCTGTGEARTDTSALPGPPHEPPIAAPASSEPIHLGPEEVALQAADLTRVDPQEIARQARAIALHEEPRAVLVGITAHGAVTAGTVDIKGGGSVLFDYQYRYFEKNRPPGADKVEGTLWVHAVRSRFAVRHVPGAMLLSVRPDPAPEPRCSARSAWKAVVQSGVPENAVASLRYGERRGGEPFLWSFDVEGHPELARQVDGATCALSTGRGGKPGGRPARGVPNGSVRDPW
jgi:hypothetical protein